MMSHSIKHWHRVIGHNNWHDMAKFQQEVVGMNISGSEKKTKCNICCTEKAKRASNPKTWGTRAKPKLTIVHTYLSHLHVFGCQPFVLNEVRKKLDRYHGKLFYWDIREILSICDCLNTRIRDKGTKVLRITIRQLQRRCISLPTWFCSHPRGERGR